MSVVVHHHRRHDGTSAAFGGRLALDVTGRSYGVAVARPRHPKKDLEQLLRFVEAHGWRVTQKKGYFKAYCPCGLHFRTVHLSPSDPNYRRNLTHWFERQPCWAEES